MIMSRKAALKAVGTAALAAALTATACLTAAQAATPPKGAISGTILEAGTGAPLGGVNITVIATKTIAGPTGSLRAPVPIAYGISNPNGTYTVSGLAATTTGYDVCFDDGLGPTAHYGQCWAFADGFFPFPDPFGALQPAPGSRLVRVGLTRVPGIDAELLPIATDPDSLGSIAGTVTQFGLNLALNNVRVEAFDGSALIGQAATASNGRYTMNDLSASSYRVCFVGSAANGGITVAGYMTVCTSGVGVSAGATTHSVNARMHARL
jgi:hypothetical protein